MASIALGQVQAQQSRIDAAVNRGVFFLRNCFTANGLEEEHNRVGLTALGAWTLLEAGVPARDPLIQRAAYILRRDAVVARKTYDLAPAILFFDKLGMAQDEALIQGMGVRLLAGQRRSGGWTYDSQFPDKVDEDQLIAYLDKRLKAADTNQERGPRPRTPKDLPDELRDLLRRAEKAQMPGPVPDGSNTQFALLALWVARRHALPVDKALRQAVQAFRQAQFANGVWDYYISPPPKGTFAGGRVTMTCAGLLALAVEHGIAKKENRQHPSLEEDRAAISALKQVATFLNGFDQPNVKPPLTNPGYLYYFLFSLERMAVIYDLKKVGETDWYLWGVEKLLSRQQPTGRWAGALGPADTCFAILFLRRANVARDLTLHLRGIVDKANGAGTPQRRKSGVKGHQDPFEVPKLAPKEKAGFQLLPRYPMAIDEITNEPLRVAMPPPVTSRWESRRGVDPEPRRAADLTNVSWPI